METIKLGSKGEAVKLLQRKLGLADDGVFGKVTQAKVKVFQEQHGLTADGVVGNKTWQALGLTNTTNTTTTTTAPKCIDPSVIFLPIPQCTTKKANRDIKYLAIHYTGGSNSTAPRAQNVKNTFLQRLAEKKYGSADFAVDDRDMVQFNPDIKNCYCWAVGDKKNPYSSGGSLYGKATNGNTVSIEICSTCKPATSTAVNTINHTGWSFTEATLNNAVKLAKMIMKKYNIPIERVVRHYDISGKVCPAIIGWNNEAIYDENYKKTKQNSNSNAWEEFKKRLV